AAAVRAVARRRGAQRERGGRRAPRDRTGGVPLGGPPELDVTTVASSRATATERWCPSGPPPERAQSLPRSRWSWPFDPCAAATDAPGCSATAAPTRGRTVATTVAR